MKTSALILLVLLIWGPFKAQSQEKIDLLMVNRNYEEALQQIDKRLQKQPEAELFYKKGLVLNNLQNYQEAINAFSTALELDSNNAELLTETADALSTLGSHHDATSYYERAVALHPGNLALAGKLGRNYIQLKKFSKAYTVFADIYKTDSTNVFWNKQFAFCAYQTGKTGEAIRLYENVIETNSRDYASYFNLIKLLQQTEQFGKALEIIEKGIVHFPEEPDFFQQQALYFFSNKQYGKARLAYEDYFSAGGDPVYKVLLNYGISLYFNKDEPQAIEVLDKCASQVANDPYVLFYLSLSHKKLAEYEVAEAYMNAAIESATPAYLPDMYHHLGQIFGQQRMFEESVAALKKANELDPTNYEVLFEIATTYEEFNSNKTLALNYYSIYLKEAGESARNVNYALDRIKKLREDLFFE